MTTNPPINPPISPINPPISLGERIKAKRDERTKAHAAAAKMQAQAEAADEIAALHARIDKLVADNNLTT